MKNMESKQKDTPKKKKTLLSKLLRIFAWILGSFLFLILLVLLLIQVPAVQNYGRKKVVTFLEGKLKTKVEIGKLDIKFPTAISLQNIFFEDQSKDTLLFGKELTVDIKMLQLLRNNVEIEEIYLEGIVAKVKKLSIRPNHILPDAIWEKIPNITFIEISFIKFSIGFLVKSSFISTSIDIMTVTPTKLFAGPNTLPNPITNPTIATNIIVFVIIFFTI